MEINVGLRGFPELEDALAALPNAVGRRVLRAVGKEALEPIARDAASLAPERSGRLAFSVVVSEQRTRRAKRPRSLNGATATGGQYVEVAMGVGSGLGALFYGWFVEFGTVDTPAQPFIRPAWDRGAQRAQDSVADNLWIEIRRAADREGRRQARQAAWFERNRRR